MPRVRSAALTSSLSMSLHSPTVMTPSNRMIRAPVAFIRSVARATAAASGDPFGEPAEQVLPPESAERFPGSLPPFVFLPYAIYAVWTRARTQTALTA